MQVTVGQLAAAEGALKRLQQERLPARVAFRLARILREADPILRAYNDAHTPLVERFWKPMEKKNMYAPPEGEKWEEYKRERGVLWAETVEINASPLTETDLAGVAISAGDVLALEWMIEGEVEEEHET